MQSKRCLMQLWKCQWLGRLLAINRIKLVKWINKAYGSPNSQSSHLVDGRDRLGLMEVRVRSLHLFLNRTGWRLRAQGGHGGVGGRHRGWLRLRVGQRWRGYRSGWTDRCYGQGVTLVVMGSRLLSVRWSQPVIHNTVTFILHIHLRTINL